MKIADMTPGLVHAVPANRWLGGRNGGYGLGGAAEVRDGNIAVPVLVERVGRFRARREGACTVVITEDHYTTTVVVRFPDIVAMIPNEDNRPENQRRRRNNRRTYSSFDIASAKWPGYPEGIKTTSKKFVWQDEEHILNTNDIIMPWHAFLARREERLFVNDEVAAYSQRRAELVGEYVVIMAPLLGQQKHMASGTVTVAGHGDKKIDFSGDNLVFSQSFTGAITFKQLPLATRTKLRPILDEIATIDKKLSCAR